MKENLPQNMCGCSEAVKIHNSVLCQRCLGNLPAPTNTYIIDYWTFNNWSGDPVRVEMDFDHVPTVVDLERILWEGVQSMRVCLKTPPDKNML